MQMREKVGKLRNTVFFQWFVALEGRKVGSLKRRDAAGAEPSGQTRDEKLHAVVARSTCRSQNVQGTPCPDHFWKLRCQKSARRCGAKHMSKSNPCSDHFWKLRCRKSARRCGAKHISKWKCTKHTRCGPLLEVHMSKKCTPLWREAHFEVKMYKAHQNTRGSDHFWRFRCRFAWQAHGIVHLFRSEQNVRVL